jgi:hypothetical protein
VLEGGCGHVSQYTAFHAVPGILFEPIMVQFFESKFHADHRRKPRIKCSFHDSDCIVLQA